VDIKILEYARRYGEYCVELTEFICPFCTELLHRITRPKIDTPFYMCPVHGGMWGFDPEK